MADTGGISALLSALDNTPGLGSGLKPSAKAASRSAEFFAAAANGVGSKSSVSNTATAAATASASSIRVTRPTTSSTQSTRSQSAGPQSAKSKTVIADGQAYDAKAPRGSYINIVI
ncbi:MAG TPA: hypothetical protein VGG27_20050 [Magnetospirillaceae bacterium]|jgi:hypothetical protein